MLAGSWRDKKQNQITDPEELKAFSYEGFEYNPNLGEELYPHFVREL